MNLPRLKWETAVLAATTVLFAAALCFVPPTLLQTEDYVCFYKANFRFLLDSVHEGRLPLWNPYIGLGRPYLADLQTAVFYPPLYLICLGERTGLFLLVATHCLLAVFGMRALARVLQIGELESGFVALCFLGSGALTGRWLSGQILYACGVCYVPLLFWCAAQTDRPWAGRRVAGYAALLALQFLCGHPQVFWISTLGQAVFVCARSIASPLRHSLRTIGRALLQFGGAGLWCAGLVAVALLPFLELIQEGNRHGNSSEFSNFGRMKWQHFASLIRGTSSQFDIYWEMNINVGLVVAALGIAGLWRVRERNVRGLLGVLVVGFLISIGDGSPMYGACFKWLPGFSLFRAHARAAMLVAFVLICVAGVWLSRPHPWLRAMFAENLHVPVRRFVFAIMLVQLVSMLHTNWRAKYAYEFTDQVHAAPVYPLQWSLVATLRESGLLEAGRPPPRVSVSQMFIPANHAMIHRYGTFDAYTSLFLRRPWNYLHATLNIEPDELLNTSVSAKIFMRGPFPYPDIDLVAGYDWSVGLVRLATNVGPRAFLVYAAQVAGVSSSSSTKPMQGHDIRRVALLEAPLPEPLPSDPAAMATPATITRFEPNSITLEIEPRDNAVLVLLEAWYPGWRAEVDGRAAPVIPANGWMRAMPVSAGRHQVRVSYRQNYLLPGFVISVASGMLLLVICKRAVGATAKTA